MNGDKSVLKHRQVYHQLHTYDQSDEFIQMGFNNHLTNCLFRISSANSYNQDFWYPENY